MATAWSAASIMGRSLTFVPERHCPVRTIPRGDSPLWPSALVALSENASIMPISSPKMS